MAPRLRIVTGKGGVGRTVVACALALAEAERGKNVLLAEMRAGDRVASLFAVPAVGFRMREVVDRIWAVDMNAEDAIHEYVLTALHFEAVYRAVFENRFVRSLVRLVPSLAELIMLSKILFHSQEKRHGRWRFDVIILDAPATGHALALLRTPKTICSMIPGGPMRQVAANIEAMLTTQDHTELHVVATPEEMPINEAMELERAARLELGIRLGRAVVNQTVAALPTHVLTQILASTEPSLAASVRALQMREGKRRDGNEQLARLPTELATGAISLPRLVTPSFGLAELTVLSHYLRPIVA